MKCDHWQCARCCVDANLSCREHKNKHILKYGRGHPTYDTDRWIADILFKEPVVIEDDEVIDVDAIPDNPPSDDAPSDKVDRDGANAVVHVGVCHWWKVRIYALARACSC